MAKLAQSTSKYTIVAKFDADGTIEKPDVIGAVFGQTEGLLGSDMDLRELQQTGRVGRIDVYIETMSGKSNGTITIPSSLDSSETALIAACIETIERVGPCIAKIRIEKIEDVRTEKRKYMVERAKELLTKMFSEGQPETQEITEQIKEAVRSSEISMFRGLPAGPNIETYDSIIIVEGRADVLNLLRCGIKNVIAVEGTSISRVITDLTKQKEVTVFLDGDRGGDLILKELLATSDVDFVARAPQGKEVEELTKKEIHKSLRDKLSIDQAKRELENGNGAKTYIPEARIESRIPKPKLDQKKKEKFREIINSLTGTRAAFFLDGQDDVLGKVPVREMFNTMKEIEAESLVFDGIIDQKLVTFCSQRGIKFIVGMKSGKFKESESVAVLIPKDLQ